MDDLNFNKILNRENMVDDIKKFLDYFESNKKNLSIKRGIYLYGNPGSGKTTFIKNILTEMNYDIINYDAGDIRNKSVIDTITEQNMANVNVLSLLLKKSRKIAIIMDEIDGMNNGDKGGINSLIKIIRPKKTKKQRLEDISYIPIICISNYHIDKKIKELIKVCSTFEFKSPTNNQISSIVKIMMPNIFNDVNLFLNIIKIIQNDLKKLTSIYKIYSKQPDILKNEIIINIFQQKTYNEDTKEITKKLINHQYSINDHNKIMNETDRTIVGLLWHENIVESLNKIDKKKAISLYI